jgi:ferric-dicitrate binding protein FerR (iron transport regulator)
MRAKPRPAEVDMQAAPRIFGSLALVVLAGAMPGAAFAQASGCQVTTLTDPPRDVLRCRDGLEIVAEKGADYSLIDRKGSGRPEGIRLTGKAVLIDLPRKQPGGFQVITPHAIAAVRGTLWAVDVGADTTSVFVSRGSVGVRRPASRRAVVLKAGDGVDVTAGDAPLQVKHWSTERAARLLARLGR